MVDCKSLLIEKTLKCKIYLHHNKTSTCQWYLHKAQHRTTWLSEIFAISMFKSVHEFEIFNKENSEDLFVFINSRSLTILRLFGLIWGVYTYGQRSVGKRWGVCQENGALKRVFWRTFAIGNGVNRHSNREMKKAKCGHLKDQAVITQLSTIIQAINIILKMCWKRKYDRC